MIKDMSTLFPAVNSSSASGQTGGRRRFAASLLVGWFAFWLNSALLACCVGLTQDVMSAGAAVLANGQAAELNLSDHDGPLRSACTELSAPAGAAASAAPGPTDRPDSRVAEFTAPIHSVASAAHSSAKPRFVSAHPQHVPLYLRTARLLI